MSALLPVEIDRVGGVGLEPIRHGSGKPVQLGPDRRQFSERHTWMGQELERRAADAVLVEIEAVSRRFTRRQAQGVETRARRAQGRLRGPKRSRPIRPDAAELHAFRRQPLVGVVDAQAEPVLRARGEHAVGLAHAARDQVVDEHADIGLGAVEHDAVRARRRGGPR